VAKRLPDFLHAEEVPRVLNALSDRWRPLFATAIFTGMRRGELLGLRKSDVDLTAGLINITRSHAQGTTKGKRAEAIPIARELVPYLQQALKRSSSELVFPNQKGEMMRPDVALEGVLRRALGRAGIVQGYEHVCRKKECGLL
jgi:integrase